MKIFSALYKRTMDWARHPHAQWYLAGLSFAESSFFPIPPDIMLAPMSLAHPQQAWWLATLTTVTSVLGGLLGYAIGWLAFDMVSPMLHNAGYWPLYLRAQEWYTAWGFWAVFIAAFTPIPYKMFTIAAGVMNMALIPFTVASMIGRGGRFFLVAGIMAWGGGNYGRDLACLCRSYWLGHSAININWIFGVLYLSYSLHDLFCYR